MLFRSDGVVDPSVVSVEPLLPALGVQNPLRALVNVERKALIRKL